MLVGYARVSTTEQSLDKYIDILVEAGVDSRNIYHEKISGRHRNRPELNRMITELKPDDLVVIPDLTRLGRSVSDLYNIVQQIHNKGANLRSLRETWLNTEDIYSRLLFAIFSGLSEFESSMISERVKEGLKAAKARGRMGGRPSKRKEKSQSVALMYNGGMKIADIVRHSGISRSTVNRIVSDIKSEKHNINVHGL